MLRDFETVTAVKKIIVVNRIAPPIQETLAFFECCSKGQLQKAFHRFPWVAF